MPRAKGPEKVAFKVTVPKTTYEVFEQKANSRPVATFVAEWMNQQAGVVKKNMQRLGKAVEDAARTAREAHEHVGARNSAHLMQPADTRGLAPRAGRGVERSRGR